MIKNNRLFSVLTGDVVNSSKLDNPNRVKLLDILKSSFALINNMLPKAIMSPFVIFRGDSFQGVLNDPGLSIKVALLIRAQLIHEFSIPSKRNSIDARIAIGVGTIGFIPKNKKGSEGDGQAFQLSGTGLDKMKKYQHLVIRTPWDGVDKEFDAECALLDALMNRWSAVQAEAVLKQLGGLNQEKVAKELGITQPAVVSRLKSAGSWAIDLFCKRFETLIQNRAI